jgi:hypothetical protein
MGRIDSSGGQDSVMKRRHINSMLNNIEEYEVVKSRKHDKFSTLEDFYRSRGLCRQNFLKYYRRYVISGRDVGSLIPKKTGRKFSLESEYYSADVITQIKNIRSRGYNRFEISGQLKKQNDIEISSSSIYRLMCKLGINQLNPDIKEEKRRIIKMSTGELGHTDIHYIAKGTVKDLPNKKLYILGVIDNCLVPPSYGSDSQEKYQG